MRLSRILLATCLAAGCTTGSILDILGGLERRQGNGNNGLPTLGGSAGLPSGTTSASASASGSITASRSGTGTPTPTASGTASEASTASDSQSGSVHPSTTVPATDSRTTAPTAEPTPTRIVSDASGPEGLPIQPRITPALSIGGVVLLLTGIAYGLIGVKNKWVHVSLSSAYLTSLSVCVLIVYVMNPPVSNAIQGAYFVGIFMTGVIFGAGALIFKEVTEGLGCLLGGFCLAMWFLTLKDGGLITNTTGKAIFIAVFCALAWATSFSHITRPYALIGSTSFSGSTAFILGVDCFSRGGLKEFWLWIWNLNPNLFPLSATTYPITRGTRVETIIIVLGCLIGIMSQLKLWKVVKDRQMKRTAEQQDESRRQEVVEAALGRHLERRNDRDKSEWERQYGNLLHAKRETILWSDTHRDKKTYSRISETGLGDARHSTSMDSLEMGSIPQRPQSVYVARIKRQSGVPVDTITEVDEADHPDSRSESRMLRSPSSGLLKRDSYVPSRNSAHGIGSQTSRENLKDRMPPGVYEDDGAVKVEIHDPTSPSEPRDYPTLKVGSRAAFRSPEPEEYLTPRGGSRISLTKAEGKDSQRHSTSSKRLTNSSSRNDLAAAAATAQGQLIEHARNAESPASQYLVAPDVGSKKRKSWSSMFSKASAKDGEYLEYANASQEELIVPSNTLHHSRASSLAATLDSENEARDLNIDTNVSHVNTPPNIRISPIRPPDSGISLGQRKVLDEFPQPPALDEEEEIIADPEELVRPVTVPVQGGRNSHRQSSSGHESLNIRSGLGSEIDQFEDGGQSHAETTNTSMSEILTKGALEKLPNQLSNIVLSYRTNEWAKHASSAEAPLYEEPENTAEESAEIPAHLLTQEEAEKQIKVTAPPPLSRPMTALSVAPPTEVAVHSPVDGVKVNPALQDQSPVSSTVWSPSVAPQIPANRKRASSDVNRSSLSPRGLRSSSTPMLVPTLAGATIDENTAVNFVPSDPRVMSTASINRLSADSSVFARPQNGYTHAGTHPYGTVQRSATGGARSGSRLSLTLDQLDGAMPNASQTSLQQPMGLVNGRLETRLASYNSHQPQRRNTDLESQRREAMFADWRMSQQKTRGPPDHIEAHHAQRIMEKMQAKQAEEYEKQVKAQQEMQMGAAMRGRDMQEAHREAMRRMQAGVNKKLPH